jgi:hypothetical protein
MIRPRGETRRYKLHIRKQTLKPVSHMIGSRVVVVTRRVQNIRVNWIHNVHSPALECRSAEMTAPFVAAVGRLCAGYPARSRERPSRTSQAGAKVLYPAVVL